MLTYLGAYLYDSQIQATCGAYCLLFIPAHSKMSASPPPIVLEKSSEVLPPVLNRPPSEYDAIYDYFLCEGWKRPQMSNICRKANCLVISMRGVCPIHNKMHANNHFYIIWFYNVYGTRAGDFLSCHHGVEKHNRTYLYTRLELAHLK